MKLFFLILFVFSFAGAVTNPGFDLQEFLSRRKYTLIKADTSSIISSSRVFSGKLFNIQMQLYNPYISIDEKLFRLKKGPQISGNKIILDHSDTGFITNLIIRLENYAAEKKKEHRSIIMTKSQEADAHVQTEDVTSLFTSFNIASNTGNLDCIIIDPGHGGKDPGAIAYGIEEKTLTLRIAELLRHFFIETAPDTRIYMTRTNDVFVSLEDRCRYANKSIIPGENGLFLSIHFNSWFDSSTSGFELYYLSHETNNEKSRIRAVIENRAFFSNSPDAADNEDESINPLELILGRFEVIQYQKESRKLAQDITWKVYTTIRDYPVNRGIKSELFYVLKGAVMPGVLIEIGFMTNIKDMEYINDDVRLTQLISAVGVGVLKYAADFKKSGGFTGGLFTDFIEETETSTNRMK